MYTLSPASKHSGFPVRTLLIPFVACIMLCLMPQKALAAKPSYTIRLARKTLFVGEKMKIETKSKGRITFTFASSNKNVLSVSKKTAD